MIDEKKMVEKLRAEKRDSAVESISQGGKDGWWVHTEDGYSVFVDKKYGITPKVKDKMSVYGAMGQRIQGIDVNGKELFFKTALEMDEEHRKWSENWHKEEAEKYKALMEKIKDESPFETVDITGMGSGYERACQLMLRAGMKFLMENPEFHFDYQGIKGVYGICETETPWGKKLDKALMDAVGGDCTGAMHQAVIGHLQYIHKHGYEKWLKQVPTERRYTYPSGLPPPDI